MPNLLTHTHITSTPACARGDRDRRLLSYVGRHGAVSIAHVMAALGVGQSAAYDRVAGLIDAGLLERLDLLRAEPPLLRATRTGLRYAGLGLAPAVVSPGSVDHWLRCGSVALRLEALYGAHRILTERELLAAERHEERPIASARIGESSNGAPRLHRPDLVVLPEGHPLAKVEPLHICGAAPVAPVSGLGGPDRDDARQRVISVEVELTPKSPRRLREIVRGWRRASWVSEVRYLCEAGPTRRAVERAVERLHASDRVRVEELSR